MSPPAPVWNRRPGPVPSYERKEAAMRAFSFRLYLSFFVLLFAPAVFAHDVTITGTQTFASLDGSSSDHDGATNGVFTVSDGNLIVNGVVNCNDDGASPNACPMAFAVSGSMTIN